VWARARVTLALSLLATAGALLLVPQTSHARLYLFRVTVQAKQEQPWRQLNDSYTANSACEVGPGGGGNQDLLIHNARYSTGVTTDRRGVYVNRIRARARVDRSLDLKPFDAYHEEMCGLSQPDYAYDNDCGSRAHRDPSTGAAGIQVQFPVQDRKQINFHPVFAPEAVDDPFDRCFHYGPPPVPRILERFHREVLRTPAARLSVRRLLSRRPYTVRGSAQVSYEYGHTSFVWKATFQRLRG
jgi:hypothetical protein